MRTGASIYQINLSIMYCDGFCIGPKEQFDIGKIETSILRDIKYVPK